MHAAQKYPSQVTSGAKASVGELFLKFLIIGTISFGGGIIAYLRRTLVDETKWLTEEQFLRALELSQVVPGTNSANMAVIVGDFLCGLVGSVAALAGICLPGAVLAFVLAIGSSAGRHHPIGHAALLGVTAGAVGILASITFRMGKPQFIQFPDVAILLLTFVGMSLLKLPLLLLVVVLGGVAVFIYRPRKGSHE
jgi:chromate transporter